MHRKEPERPALAGGRRRRERRELTFTLRMDAGGPTGPLVNAMLAPALEPAVEDLANKIAAHLEALPRAGFSRELRAVMRSPRRRTARRRNPLRCAGREA